MTKNYKAIQIPMLQFEKYQIEKTRNSFHVITKKRPSINCTRGSRVNDVVDVIIRPAPAGAGQTTPEQTGHYSHYNTKLANSWYFHRHRARLSCSSKSSEHCHPLCVWTNAIAQIVLNEGHKLIWWIWRMSLQLFNPYVGLCLIPNKLLLLT